MEQSTPSKSYSSPSRSNTSSRSYSSPSSDKVREVDQLQLELREVAVIQVEAVQDHIVDHLLAQAAASSGSTSGVAVAAQEGDNIKSSSLYSSYIKYFTS